MRPSLLRLFHRTMVYTAPSHTVPDPAVLSRLTTATANPWTLEKTLRDLTQFKDCCGEQGTTAEAGSSSKSELLKKDFKFKTFKEAWRFMGRIADKAESMKVGAPPDNVLLGPAVPAVVVHPNARSLPLSHLPVHLRLFRRQHHPEWSNVRSTCAVPPCPLPTSGG